MKIIIFFIFTIISFGSSTVIAHRGSSGKYPENTMEAFNYAKNYADYLEQDLQLTKDNKLIVFHDRVLDNVTDVKKVFSFIIARKDGKYYVIDFNLDELKKLKVTNRYFIVSMIKIEEFKNRKYDIEQENRITSFEEVLDLVKEYNQENNKKIGIYPELKDVWFYKKEGKDITKELFKILEKYNYQNKQSEIFIQSYDSTELIRVKKEFLPKYDVDYKLVQLIPKRKSGDIKIFKDGKVENYDYKYFYSKNGLKKIKEYAYAVGVDKSLIYGTNEKKEYYEYAKEIGLEVHAYTFNLERVTKGFKSYKDEVKYFRDTLKIDGYFSDYPEIKIE